jgi:Tol biopolymer transport system component
VQSALRATWVLAILVLTTTALNGCKSEPGAEPWQKPQITFDELNDDGYWRIFVANADGSGKRGLTSGPGDDFAPAWSPDGRLIAFVSTRDGHAGIYVMNPDGSNQTRIVSSGLSPVVWSPDSARIAYIRGSYFSWEDGPPHGEVLIVSADGSGAARSTSQIAWSAPSWSPDGTRLAFSGPGPNRRGEAIYTMSADSPEETRLNTPLDFFQGPLGDVTTKDPSWSPDGERIAFSSFRDGNYEIFVMTADGSSSSPLTQSPQDEWLPVWSPSGNSIAYSHESAEPFHSDLFVMKADGTIQHRVRRNDGLAVESIVWGPNGYIAYTSLMWLMPFLGEGSKGLYVVREDGSRSVRLSEHTLSPPSWSPPAPQPPKNP